MCTLHWSLYWTNNYDYFIPIRFPFKYTFFNYFNITFNYWRDSSIFQFNCINKYQKNNNGIIWGCRYYRNLFLCNKNYFEVRQFLKLPTQTIFLILPACLCLCRRLLQPCLWSAAKPASDKPEDYIFQKVKLQAQGILL